MPSESILPPLASVPPPRSWYRFGPLREIRRAPTTRTLCGRRLVAFDPGDGPVVLDGTCSHLGADLGRGRVVEGRLECPFHHWRFDARGRCDHGDHLNSWPTAIRYGQLFVFLGPEPLFGLPRHLDFGPDDLYAAPHFSFDVRMHWSLALAQAFDSRHFESVHGRRLTAPAEITEEGPFCRRIRLQMEIVGSDPMDRATRWVAGSRVELEVLAWAGTLGVVHARFDRGARTFGLMVCQPVARDRTLVEIFIAARRRRGPAALLNPLVARLKSMAVHSMTAEDVPVLDGIEADDRHLGAGDGSLCDYFSWIRNLPGVDGPWETSCV